MGDVLVIGGPSALMAWGEGMLREAAGMAERPWEVVFLGPEDGAAVLAAPRQTSDRLYVCHFPGPAAIALLDRGLASTVAFIEAPYDSVLYNCRITGASLPDVVRALTLSYSFIPRLVNDRENLVVCRQPNALAGDMIQSVLDHAHLSLPRDRLQLLMDRHAAAGASGSLESAIANVMGPHYAPLGEMPPSTTEWRVVEQVLVPIRDAVDGGEAKPIVWHREFFRLGDRPDEPVPPAIDLTGRARVILFGPNAYLPLGMFDVTVLMAFSAETAEQPFRLFCVQGSTQEILYEAQFAPPRAGLFTASFLLRNARPHQAIGILIRMERGAIDGRLSFLQVTLEPVDEQSQEIDARKLMPGK